LMTGSLVCKREILFNLGEKRQEFEEPPTVKI